MIFQFCVKRIRLICNEATTMYNLFVTGEYGYWEQNISYKFELYRTSEFLDPGIPDKYRKYLGTSISSPYEKLCDCEWIRS